MVRSYIGNVVHRKVLRVRVTSSPPRKEAPEKGRFFHGKRGLRENTGAKKIARQRSFSPHLQKRARGKHGLPESRPLRHSNPKAIFCSCRTGCCFWIFSFRGNKKIPRQPIRPAGGYHVFIAFRPTPDTPRDYAAPVLSVASAPLLSSAPVCGAFAAGTSVIALPGSPA